MRVFAFLVEHEPVGYRIEYKGRVVVISGDTRKTENVARHAKGPDMLIHEAYNKDIVHAISDQVGELNAFLRGHYAYYGVAGNLRCLVKVYRAGEHYWHRMLRSRSWAARRLTWEKYHQIKARTPLLKPKAAPPICGVAGSCSAANQLPKSVVR